MQECHPRQVAGLLCTLLLACLAVPAEDAVLGLARQALQAREQGDTVRSIALYQRFLAVHPDDPEAWWYQALNYYDLDWYVEAEQAFRRVVELNPRHGGALVFLGLCEFRNRKYRDALAHIVLGQRLGIPEGSELERVAYLHYLILLNKLGQFELASSVLAEAVHTRPDTPMLLQLAGLSTLRLPLLPFEIPDDLLHPVALAGEATILAWKRDLPAAEAKAKQLLAAYPGLANAYYLLGYIYSLQHSELALQAFLNELRVSPNHVQARLQIALLYLQQGEPAKALPYARQAVVIAPNDFAARDIYGRVLLELDQVSEAVVQLEKAVELAPTSPEAHFHLAGAYMRAGDPEKAARHRELFVQLRQRRAHEPAPRVEPLSEVSPVPAGNR